MMMSWASSIMAAPIGARALICSPCGHGRIDSFPPAGNSGNVSLAESDGDGADVDNNPDRSGSLYAFHRLSVLAPQSLCSCGFSGSRQLLHLAVKVV